MSSDDAIIINDERFFSRLQSIVTTWTNNKTNSHWNNADAVCITAGSASEEVNYNKTAALHLYLFGIELTDLIIIITKNTVYFMSSAKKINILQNNLKNATNAPFTLHYLTKVKDDGVNKESFNELISVIRKSGGKIGTIKGQAEGTFIADWSTKLDSDLIQKVDVTSGLGYILSIKDDVELDLCRRASVLTNKVMKHGFVKEMEDAIDKETKIKHSVLAGRVESIIYDPSKINIKIPPDVVDCCYTPIIQSGGVYDIKPSAQSNDSILSSDVIICSLGARYKNYCANISRTYMVDAPLKVENTYKTLMSLYDHCMAHMTPGKELRHVYEAAKKYLEEKDKSLIAYLPKNLGSCIGLEFRDSSLLISPANNSKFKEGMIVNLSIGLHNVPILPEDVAKSPATIQKLKVFSLLLADTVRIQNEGIPDVLTKSSREFSDVSYNINDKGSDDDDEDDDDEEDDAGKEEVEKEDGVRRSRRAVQEKSVNEQAAVLRLQRQREIMQKRIEEALRMQSGDDDNMSTDEKPVEARELQAYRSTEDYPNNVQANQVRVDMDKECLILPLNGVPVPFHVSTIKNITMPEADRAVWMRINFYIPGTALGKEVSQNTQQLIAKHGKKYAFIKEVTFRSMNGRNLSTAYQQYSELRKRVRQRELKAEQEKDLVVQDKIIKIKDQRVPRLQDVTMRPNISTGRKSVGVLEAHQNGLRFTSTKGEIQDILYRNVKHCVYQPCDKTTMVLIHFHLKDHVMIGKKKFKDVQVFTDVIDASENIEASRRSSYDPDELDDEQRQREMRKRMNLLFKEFCQKIEKVAAHYNYALQIDVPFRKSAFEGVAYKEMVLLQPTTHCLVNLTENPQLVVVIADIDHIHFERVTYTTKNFDMVIIYKNLEQPVKSITLIDMKYLDIVQDWLNLVEISFTMSSRPLAWVEVLKIVKDSILDGVFYKDEYEGGERKPAGWLFLPILADGGGVEGDGEEGEGEDGDEDSSFSEESDSESESESDSDDSEDYEDEDDDSEEYDDDDMSEEGKDWDELEKDAIAADKIKQSREEREEEAAPRKKSKR